MAAQVRRGELALPNDDVAADRYVVADEVLAAAGLHWYEVSNWARAGGECRHNLAYWRGDDWWGIGAGRALARRRRALVERQAPAAYTARLEAGLARRGRARCSTTRPPHSST